MGEIPAFQLADMHQLIATVPHVIHVCTYRCLSQPQVWAVPTGLYLKKILHNGLNRSVSFLLVFGLSVHALVLPSALACDNGMPVRTLQCRVNNDIMPRPVLGQETLNE